MNELTIIAGGMVAFLQAYWFELLAVATVIAMPIVTIYALIDD